VPILNLKRQSLQFRSEGMARCLLVLVLVLLVSITTSAQAVEDQLRSPPAANATPPDPTRRPKLTCCGTT